MDAQKELSQCTEYLCREQVETGAYTYIHFCYTNLSVMLGAHAHEGYSTLFVCVCVCLPFSGSIKCLYNILITTIGFVLNAKDFQLTDFSEKPSFESYIVFCSFYDMVAILLC